MPPEGPHVMLMGAANNPYLAKVYGHTNAYLVLWMGLVRGSTRFAGR